MIVEALFNLVMNFLEFAFSWLALPGLPDEVQAVIDEFQTAITQGIGIIGIFIDWNMVLKLIPFVIVIINLSKVWSLVMFVLRKIPFLNVE